MPIGVATPVIEGDRVFFTSFYDGALMLKSDKPLQICRVDQRTERAVRSVIDDTRGYRISGNTLELLDQKGKRLAKLER